MKFSRCLFAMLTMVAAATLVGCGGQGSSASAPTGLTVTGEDTQITLSWDVVSGVKYNVYCAPGSSVDNTGPSNWYATLGGFAITGANGGTVLPPFTVDRVQNGLLYACTVDGRYGDGAAGPVASSQTATPRLAGASWQSASSVGLGTSLRAVAAGRLSGFTSDKFFAVGTSGQLQYSDDYASGVWTSVSLPAELVTAVGDLNTAIVYQGRLYIAGSAGVVAYTSDLQGWVKTGSLGGAIHKIASNNNQYPASGTLLVAVGASGLIRYSTDGANWVTPTNLASTTPHLKGVAYSEAGYWVAVGDASGGMATVWVGSSNGTSWSPATGIASQTANLASVAALKVQTPDTSNYVYQLVAVGDSGTVGYSSDGQAWSWQTLSGAPQLSQVGASNQLLVKFDYSVSPVHQSQSYAGGQFMIAGAGGKAWRSGDGLSWDHATWTDVSSATGTTVNPLQLLHYTKLGTYSRNPMYAYTWLLYGVDGTGRSAR